MSQSHQKRKNLILHVEQIKDGEFFHEFEEDPLNFPVLSEMVNMRECEFRLPLSIRLKAFRVREMFEVQGTFRTRIRLTCSRCLKDFETPLICDFELTYTREVPGHMDVLDREEIELKAEEIGLMYFKGEEINIEQGVQEQVVMAFPLQPLCDRNCKGLCPHCGADLNQGKCGCMPEPRSHPFAVLKNLKPDKI